MRAPSTLLAIASLVLAVGCGTDIAGKITCSADKDCRDKAASLFEADASVDLLPLCCSNVCVLPSVGCDSGLRYLNSKPGYGECTGSAVSCPVPPDMSTPPDLMSGG